MKRIIVSRFAANVIVGVDYGYGPQFAASIPTGAGAGYQEARDENMAECNRKVSEFVVERVRRFPGVEVVTLDMSHLPH